MQHARMTYDPMVQDVGLLNGAYLLPKELPLITGHSSQYNPARGCKRISIER